jgi:hypothetical protein
MKIAPAIERASGLSPLVHRQPLEMARIPSQIWQTGRHCGPG